MNTNSVINRLCETNFHSLAPKMSEKGYTTGRHSDDEDDEKSDYGDDDDEDENDSSTSSSSDLGIHDATNDDEFNETNGLKNGDPSSNTTASTGATDLSNNSPNESQIKVERKATLHRKQRGLMQWKPMRNVAFAKNETKFAIRRTMNKGSLKGRQPDVETEA